MPADGDTMEIDTVATQTAQGDRSADTIWLAGVHELKGVRLIERPGGLVPVGYGSANSICDQHGEPGGLPNKSHFRFMPAFCLSSCELRQFPFLCLPSQEEIIFRFPGRACVCAGKRFGDFKRLDGTLRAWEALAVQTGKHISQLVVHVARHGTWLHPVLLRDLQSWCIRSRARADLSGMMYVATAPQIALAKIGSWRGSFGDLFCRVECILLLGRCLSVLMIRAFLSAAAEVRQHNKHGYCCRC